MASILAHQLRLNAQSLGALRSICKKHSYGLGQHSTRLKHRPSAIRTACLPSQISTFNRSSMSSSSHKQGASIGMEWYDLSVERQIKWLLDAAYDKWGWVIYRCTYKPELQGAWESFKNLVESKTRKEIADSDAPDIAEKLDWAWIEDPELEGASLDELKRRFRAWVRTDKKDSSFVYDVHTATYSLGSRYSYFIQVDEESLLSCLREAGVDLNRGHVNIVRGWVDSLAPEEATDEFGNVLDVEDWMKIQASMVDSGFYVELDDNESWYAYYMSPPSVLPYY